MAGPHLQTTLHASRDRLFALIRDLTEEQFRHTPSHGDGWTIAAHLAHLLRTERLFAERAALARKQDGIRIESTRALNDDDPALAQRLAVPQIIHGMQAARRVLFTATEGADDATLSRGIEHETRGPMTIAAIAEKMAAHEHEHADTIEAIVRDLPAKSYAAISLTPRT